MLSGSDHRSEKRNITPLDKQELDAGPPEAMEKVLVYPTGLKLAIIMFGLCLSVFCVALDNKIIATAIPRITDHFHALRCWLVWLGLSSDHMCLSTFLWKALLNIQH